MTTNRIGQQCPTTTARHLTLFVTVFLAAFVWMIDSLFDYLWIHQGQGSLLHSLLPLADGHELFTRSVYCTVLMVSGMVTGSLLQRLTVQKKAAQMAAESLRITLNSIGDAVIATDIQGRITHMNPIAEILTGWQANEALNQALTVVFNIVNAKTRKQAVNPVEQVLASGQIIGLANHTLLIARDGAEYQIADSAAPIQDTAGGTTGVVMVFRNVTEEYRMRLEIEQSHALLKEVVEQSHVPMLLVTSADRHIKLINPSCREVLGITDDHDLDRPIDAIDGLWNEYDSDGHLVSREDTPLAKALRGVATHGLELQVKDAENTARYLIAEGVPIFDADGNVLAALGLFLDITERKSLEEERKRLQHIESIGTLAGGIAHDFNNILTGIFGRLELAKISLANDHAAYGHIETAHQALDRAVHLTKQLLTFAKGGDPILEAVKLQDIIVEGIQFNVSGSTIKAHLDLPDDLWAISADKGQIGQVIANLIINAQQAMPNGGNLYFHAENVTHVPGRFQQHAGAFVKISARDEGVGISPKIIEKIFDPYFSTKQTGSGLGLAIVHSIITKHRGAIHVESTPDVGTTFVIYLPAKKSPPTLPVPTGTPVPGDRSGRILVMDDEEVVREIVSEMLKFCGFDVECATCGEEALAQYSSALQGGRPFDVVIMDLTIPGAMGGKEAAAQLLTIDPDAKTIVASGYATSPVMANYQAHGFKGRLVKPFQLEELQAAVDAVLQES